MFRLTVATLGLFAIASLADTAKPERSEWSAIKGRIVWAGAEIPKRRVIEVPARDAKHAPKGEFLAEDWVIHETNKGVRWTFVWLAAEPGSDKRLPVHPSLRKVPADKVEIKQQELRYVPHAIAIRAGQTLVIRNADSTVHNACIEPSFRASLLFPPKGEGLEVNRLKASQFPYFVSCNIHPWMTARVAVVDHPYFAVTDENGAFAIPLAPVGKYRLKVWHEGVGWRDDKDGKPIEVKNEKVTDLGDLGLKTK